MRKFISILSVFLLCVCGVSAQVVDDLAGKAVRCGVALGSFEPETWYFLHQSRDGGSNGGAGTHSDLGGYPVTGGFMWDRGVGEKGYKSAFNAVVFDDAEEGEYTLTTVAAKYMVRFHESPEQEGAYIIEYGTGNYLDGDLNSAASIHDAVDLNVYTITVEGEPQEGHFALNKWNMGSRLDNNGMGNSLAWWSSGELNSINGNNDWAIHEVVFVEFDGADAALQAALAVANEYYERIQNNEFVGGTEPGQYDPEAVAAFAAAVDAALELDTPLSVGLTEEEINAYVTAMHEAYEAMIATRVYFTVPDGYYRIVSAMTWTKTETIPAETEDGEPTTVETHPTKAIYVDGKAVKWGDIERDNCTYLWKLEQTPSHNFWLSSAATDGGFNNIATSAGATLADTATVVRFVVLRNTEEGETVVGFTGEKQTGAQQYAHCGGHSGGAGNGGNIVGWGVGGIAASEWILEAVSAEEAAALIEAYAPIKYHEVLVAQYDSIRTNAAAQLIVAEDKFTTLYEDQPLISEGTQFYSPNTTTDAQAFTEAQIYDLLLDGSLTTGHWHSAWEAGNVAPGTHYLQVELPEGKETLESAAIRIGRRNAANDHPTTWEVYGTNTNDKDSEDKVAKADCERLGFINTPFGNNTETVTSDVFPIKGYKYIRFYIYNTAGSNYRDRGYGHLTEFQMYPAEVGQRQPNQFAVLGELATNLQAVLDAQADIDLDELTVEEFNALKDAYDAFVAKYTDPAPLRAKLAEVDGIAATIKIGTNPGEWPNTASGDALTKAIADATAYDLSADYTPAQSAEWIKTLTEAAEAVPAAANQIKEGKWYTFRFGTHEEYEALGWGTDDASENIKYKNDADGNPTDELTTYYLELFGKYLSIGVKEEEEETVKYELYDCDGDEVAMGSNVWLIDDSDIDYPESKMWRFVNVGDTAYVLQNKATGMYLKAAGASGAMTLSMHPSLVAGTKAVGNGAVVVPVRALLGGAAQSYMHIQRDGNHLVTWNNDAPGCNSCFFVEEAGDVADYEAGAFHIAVQEGKMEALCYPVALTLAQEGAVMYSATIKDTEVTLNPIEGNKVKAGQPFILVAGNTADYVESTKENPVEPKLVAFTHGEEFVTEPVALGSLQGTFVGERIGAGKVWCEGNTLALTKKSASTVGANSAWVAAEEDLDLEAELTITFSAETIDGISTAIETVAKSGDIYTIDGRLVGKGNVNSLPQLGRGIYILNGVKVTVK